MSGLLPSHRPRAAQADVAQADITLLLEGTYPYVRGGVSSWVHRLLLGLPELRFSLVFLGGRPELYEKQCYELPPNVVHLECHYLEQPARDQRLLPTTGDAEFHQSTVKLHDAMRDPTRAGLAPALEDVVQRVLGDPERHERDFLSGQLAYAEIARGYDRSAGDQPFLDYFWSLRSMHAPVFQMARIAANVPPTRAYHVISTGFAGLLGAFLNRQRHRPLILTEHGIYTKERRIELLNASWLGGAEPTGGGVGVLRQLWIRFFEALGRMTYEASSPIVSLYEGNRLRQIRDGAAQERTQVVPNGIDLDRFAPLRRQRQKGGARVLGLIGRVVPIKDIKTFVRMVRVVRDALPDVEGWVVGPEDEDRVYAGECRHLATTLGLGEGLKFLGFRNVNEILPRLSLNVLTSISEAQPLSVLEGFAAGVPCIATDVGCCRDLVFGAHKEDRVLGAAGDVVPIADPEAAGRAAISLLASPERWAQAQAAGQHRVGRYYAEARMLDTYRAIYQKAVGA